MVYTYKEINDRKKDIVTLAKIIDGVEMVNDVTDCNYNPKLHVEMN